MRDAPERTLADRLHMTVAISPLRMRLRKLMMTHPSKDASCIEDWLLDVANARGARVVVRRWEPEQGFVPPGGEELPNEDLVVALCHLQSLDRPQILRAAAQLVSRGAVDAGKLLPAIRRERVEVVLAEMARQALRVEPDHAVWSRIQAALSAVPPPRDPVIHWTRLSEPVPDSRGVARGWRLVA